MKIKVNKKQNNSDMCIVCGTQNPLSLGARFYECESGILVGVCIPNDHHQSFPNRLHGGMITAFLDESIGRAIQIHNPDDWAVTGEIAVKFRKPVPLNTQIYSVSKITRDSSRLFVAEGFIESADGEILATAKGTFVKATVEKIAGDTLNDQTWFYVADQTMPEFFDIKNLNFFDKQD